MPRRDSLAANGWAIYDPGWLENDTQVMAQILREVTVAPVMLRCYGRVTLSTRLVANVGKSYRYPSASLAGGDWTPTLAGLRDKLSVVIGVEPNESLVSCYPDGAAPSGGIETGGGAGLAHRLGLARGPACLRPPEPGW